MLMTSFAADFVELSLHIPLNQVVGQPERSSLEKMDNVFVSLQVF